MKFNKEQKNPYNQKWEVTGEAILTDEDAEVLNDTTKFTGVRYVPQDIKEVKVKDEKVVKPKK